MLLHGPWSGEPQQVCAAAARGARGQPVGHPPNKAPISYPDAARALPGSFLCVHAKIKRRGLTWATSIGKISHPSRTGEGAEEEPGAWPPNRSARAARRGRGNSAKSRGRALCQCHRCFLPSCESASVRRPRKILTCRNRDGFMCRASACGYGINLSQLGGGDPRRTRRMASRSALACFSSVLGSAGVAEHRPG